MDVGQSPIQFIDHIGSSTQPRTPVSSYYTLSNSATTSTGGVGALSSRLHQLRPAGSVPFSSRTLNSSGANSAASTMMRQGHKSIQQPSQQPSSMGQSQLQYDATGQTLQPDLYLYGYQTMPLQPLKSLSSQNLATLPQGGPRNLLDQNLTGAGGMMTAASGCYGTMDRPRPASARDPNWVGPKSAATAATGPLIGSARFRQHRSSSFDQEREQLAAAVNNSVTAAAGGNKLGGGMMYNPVTNDYISAANMLPPVGGPPPINDAFSLDYATDSFLLQREMTRMQQEFELTKEKLASSLNSIKTFWSPELKRERMLRKDENAKYVLLAEEVHQLQMEKKSMLSNIHQLETDLRKEKELRSRHNQTAQELDLLYNRCEDLEKENRVLAKQADENERRAQFQKESLVTAEENIRKLLEVVKTAKSSGGQQALNLQNLKLEKFEESQMEIERLRAHINDYSNRNIELERNMVDKDFEIARNKEQLDILTQENQALRQENESIRQDIQQTQTLQSLVDTKESKILTLENEIRLLEDELARIRDEELITPTASVNGGVDDYEKSMRNPGLGVRPHERLLKSKMETMNLEISKRDSEIYSLQSRLEMAEKQHQDQNHHINVLKEQVKTREHKISMLLADVEDFRKRLKEKETLLEKKNQILTSSQTEKHQSEAEIIDLKDQCEMKDKKISLLQRKVENLEDLLNDKENQLSNAKNKLTTLHTDYTNTEGTKVNLEESLRDKERQIERLKEGKTRLEHEFQDEIEMMKKQNSETKSRLENSDRELREKVAMLTEVREELSELRGAKFKRDSENNTLQVQLSQRMSEVTALQLEMERVKKQYSSDSEYKSNHRISELESQVNHYSESASRLQGEVDRLLTLARNLEGEKLDKDRQIQHLESQIKETQMSINNLKRTHQNEKSYINEEIESLKRREENLMADMEVVKSSLSEREARIKELEQALRESVKLSAERETYMHTQEDSCKLLESQVIDQKHTLEHVQKERNNLSQQLATAQEDMREKETQLKTLESECFKNYIPELDRQRKSNQELVLRVQALVKLIQGREFQLSDQERLSLSELGLYPDSFPMNRGYPPTGRISAGPYTSSTTALFSTGMGGGGYRGFGGIIGAGGGGGGGVSGGPAGVWTGSNPHINLPLHSGGSAFHTTMAAATQSDELAKLTRLLHDKEQMIHQQMEDITRLRLQNNDLESKVKSMDERLRNITTDNTAGGTNYLFAGNKYSHLPATTGYSNMSNNIGSISDVATLRQMNVELNSRVTYLKNLLDEKEERIKSMNTDNRSGFLQMEIERIKRETNTTVSEKDSHITLLAGEVEKYKQEKVDVYDNLVKTQSEVKEKLDKISQLESEQSKMTLDKESLQKKYQTALTHLSEKAEKIEQLEKECYQKQADEIKKLKLENEESAHRLSFMQKSLSDRDSRIEQLEKEHYKLRDEISAIQKQQHNSESEVKRLREELAYREQRIKSLQVTHNEEINQLRAATQENNSRMSQLRHNLEEKEQILKLKVTEIEKSRNDMETFKRRLRDKENDLERLTNDLAEKDAQMKTMERDYNDEMQRYQKANEDAMARVNLIQKRVDERESRLRKIEQENNELLDEIHTLRKRNHEIESNLDLLRQQVTDKDEPFVMPPASRSSSTMDMGYYSQASTSIQATILEVEKLRKQYTETLNLNSQLQKSVDEAALQNDRISMDRDMIAKKLDDLKEQHNKLNEKLMAKERELKNKEIEYAKKSSNESSKLNQQNSELMQMKAELLKEIENRELQISEMSREMENIQKLKLENESNYQSQNIQIKEMQAYIEQLVRERDDARVLASSTTGYGNSSYRMNVQDTQRLMQQQIDNATSDLEKSQKECRDLRARTQEFSRQLKETQTNWEMAVKERDNLRQQLNNKSRESQMSQLSREMERMLKTEEQHGKQLEESRKKAADSEKELNRIRQECQKEIESVRMEMEQKSRELERLQIDLREQQEQNERREEEISNSQQEESEKLKHQYATMSKKFITLQHEYETKERQIQQLTETLDQVRKENNEMQNAMEEMHNRGQQLEYDISNHSLEKEKWENEKKELEGWVGQMKEALDNKGSELANMQQTRRKSVEIQQMNMQGQLYELTEQLELKERQLDEVNRQLDNASQEIQEQEYLIQELSQKLDNVQFDTSRPSVDNSSLSTITANNRGMENSKLSNNNIEHLKSELDNVRRQLEEKDQRVHLLETECFQQQADEIERLRKELKSLSSQQSSQGDSRRSSQNQPNLPHSYSNHDIQSLKMEVDSLKREVNAKNDQLEKHERECQEKHIRRIDALQLKLRRAEEEISQLEKQLDEMRRNAEERERMLKQIKMTQHQATSVELEKLREEYSRCQEEINRKSNQIKTFEKQINSQIKEILEIKQEALTASICEKDANIALLQMTGANNTHAQQALQKMNNEKSQLQSQLKQLSSTRQKLQEEQNQ